VNGIVDAESGTPCAIQRAKEATVIERDLESTLDLFMVRRILNRLSVWSADFCKECQRLSGVLDGLGP
jgi:hypothetical protein